MSPSAKRHAHTTEKMATGISIMRTELFINVRLGMRFLKNNPIRAFFAQSARLSFLSEAKVHFDGDVIIFGSSRAIFIAPFLPSKPLLKHYRATSYVSVPLFQVDESIYGEVLTFLNK